MAEPLLQFFADYEYLQEDRARIGSEFHGLAHWIVANLPRNPERTVALRKLLEAKDCVERAYIYKDET